MDNRDKFDICSLNSSELVVLSSAVAGCLSKGLSCAEVKVIIKLLIMVIKSLEVIIEIDFIKAVECGKGNEVSEIIVAEE